MLTQQEISAGADRLDNGKLKPEDVSGLSSIFEMTFAGLVTKYTYEFEDKLEELDDTGNTRKRAAQVAGAIIKLEDLGFFGANLRGGRSGLDYSQNAEYLRLVLFAFSKIYPIPAEFGMFDIKRATWVNQRSRVSNTILTDRVVR